MNGFRQTFKNSLIILLTLILQGPGISFAQDLLFNGNFESGTFQGWTPGGDNGGDTSLAAKGTCYSSNDTTAISFSGDLTNNFAALLRANAGGDSGSVATLRSDNFIAGSGLLFNALSETSDSRTSTNPVKFNVRILDGEGRVLSELPLQTAVINLSEGCPTSKRDSAFSVHFIDTRQYSGEISIEFSQSTNTPGYAYFTLVDNVVLVEKGNVFLNQTQPIAVAGTSLTSSNILYLDPGSSVDPDNLPAPLQFIWFINGEETVRLFGMPCINLNSDAVLPAGNHVATLYVTDTINYSADTIRFVVSSNATSTDGTANSDDETTDSTENITLTTPKGDPIVNEVNLVTDGITQTDPKQECDIAVTDIIEGTDSGISGEGELSIDVNSSSDDEFDTTFIIGEGPVGVTSSNVNVQSSQDESVVIITVSIDNPEAADALTESSNPVTTLIVSNSGTSSVSITPDVSGSEVSDSDFETVLRAIEFEYTVGEGDTPVTDQRSINYSVVDSAGNSNTTTSKVTIEE